LKSLLFWQPAGIVSKIEFRLFKLMIIEIIATIGGVVMMLVPLIAWNLRRSRCTHINCCGAECDRQLMSLEEQRLDTLNKKMFSI
jgi:hypothetical protein